MASDRGSDDKLAGIHLLRDLSAESRRALEKRGRWRRFNANEQILDRDSDARDVFFVVIGRVEIVNYSSSGREVAFGQVEPGGYFGELAAIDGMGRSASVVALEDGEALIVSDRVFNELLVEQPSAAIQVLRGLAQVVRSADSQIMDLSTRKAVQRVHVELLQLGEPDGADSARWIIRPVPTQRDIARRASTSRETVARVLSYLGKKGVVTRQDDAMVILDRNRLVELAEAPDDEPMR